jgi:hypothetical protein
MVSFKIGNLRKSLANRGKYTLLDSKRGAECMVKGSGETEVVEVVSRGRGTRKEFKCYMRCM